MGTVTKSVKDMQDRRMAYHEQMKQEVMKRVASYLSEQERLSFMSGDGFVVLPEQERLHLRIDSYPYLK